MKSKSTNFLANQQILTTIGVAITVVVAVIAVTVALYQQGRGPLAPTAPVSLPQASTVISETCTVSFTVIPDPSASPTPTNTPTPTPTTPAGQPTNTPAPTATPTNTPTPTPTTIPGQPTNTPTPTNTPVPTTQVTVAPTLPQAGNSQNGLVLFGLIFTVLILGTGAILLMM